MRLRTSVLSLLGSAAFALLAGCASTQQQQLPSSEPTPPPGKEEPVTASPQPGPSFGSSPWQRARVGDRVVYTFSANRAEPNSATQARMAGRLTLEVVAVQKPWVWLKLAFTDEAGKPMTRPMMAKELIFPMSMEASRSLDRPREGTVSVEQLSAVGRTWEAKRYLQDNRPSDGPLEDRLYATNPGPLYLMNGLLSASTTLSGFGASGGSQLTLVEIQEGTEGSTAAPPVMEYPLGPGTWSDFSTNTGSGEERRRDCLSAERGYFLVISGPPPTAGGAACPSFAEAETLAMEEDLITSLSQMVSMTTWPLRQEAPKSRGTLTLQGKSVPSLTYETPENQGSGPQIRYEIYAADPWHPSLNGLSQMGRFNPLAEGVDSVDGKGQRKPTFTQKLIGWGTWVGGAK